MHVLAQVQNAKLHIVHAHVQKAKIQQTFFVQMALAQKARKLETIIISTFTVHAFLFQEL